MSAPGRARQVARRIAIAAAVVLSMPVETGPVSAGGTPVTDLSITKSDGVASVRQGDTVTYTIVATNAGPSLAFNAALTDTFPAGLTGVTWTCTATAGSNCGAGGMGSGNMNHAVTMLPGGSVTYTATGTVTGAPGSTLTNTAGIAPQRGATDPNPEDNAATDVTAIVEPVSDLAVSKTGPGSALAGDQLTYLLTLSSAGPDSASGVVLTDALPSGTTFVSAQQLAGPTNSSISTPAVGGSGAVTATWGDFPSGTTATVEVVVATDPALAPGTEITNTATVTSADGPSGFAGRPRAPRPRVDPNPANDADSVITVIGIPPVVTTTTEPAVTTTEPAVTTTEPGVTTTEPAGTTTEPAVTTTVPAATTTAPGVTTTTDPPPFTTTTLVGALPATGSSARPISLAAVIVLLGGAVAFTGAALARRRPS